jgi:Tol biopolymer transport system component
LGREGELEKAIDVPGRYAYPSLSPDARSIAYRLMDGPNTAVWIHDLVSKQSRRLTFQHGELQEPVWTSDARHVAFTAEDGIYWTRADGSSQPVKLRDSGQVQWFTPDGKKMGFILTTTPAVGEFRRCMVASIDGDPGQPRVGESQPCFASDVGAVSGAALSPDGRWLAYAAFETGDLQVLVRSFPDRGGKWQISTEGGDMPRWSANGKQLLFRAIDRRLMVVDVRTNGESFSADRPVGWSLSHQDMSEQTIHYSPDPKRPRLLVVTSGLDRRDTTLHVALNFFDEIARRLRMTAR